MEKTCRLSVLAMSVRVRYGVACARDCFFRSACISE
nr:MAG TPA: hypothetical protein [Caudoviricetes sp.]